MSDFLEGYQDIAPFAAELGRHPRTVRRWMGEPDGLPFVRIGNRILIHLPSAKAWLLARVRKPNARRTMSDAA